MSTPDALEILNRPVQICLEVLLHPGRQDRFSLLVLDVTWHEDHPRLDSRKGISIDSCLPKEIVGKS